MIIAGASRHSKEVIGILRQNNGAKIKVFDDVSTCLHSYFEEYEWIKTLRDIETTGPAEFVLGLGGTHRRFEVATKLKRVGLKLSSVISSTAVVGSKDVELGVGINIMDFVFISDCVKIGEGSLINAYASIHHDSNIGIYCDISPRATLLGGSRVGDFSSIGAGAIVLPDISVGKNVIIGAGAVVTKNLPDNSKAYGVPAKIITNENIT